MEKACCALQLIVWLDHRNWSCKWTLQSCRYGTESEENMANFHMWLGIHFFNKNAVHWKFAIFFSGCVLYTSNSVAKEQLKSYQ